MYDIMHLPGVIELGYTGENDFRPIAFDMKPWLQKMPDGVPSIIHIRPGETASEAYVCATEFEDGILTWKPGLGDLGEVEGYGQAQIWMEEILTDGTRRGKSAKFQTFVQGAVNEASSDVPAAQQAWINQMTGLKDQTVIAKNAAVAANNAAQDAKTSAETAQGKAEEAQGKAEDALTKAPMIGTNGNWYRWNTSQGQWVDTGVPAQGPTGQRGIQGEQGIQGPIGPQGNPGQDGSNGVIMTVTASQYGFSVNDAGHLILTYGYGEAPDFHIDSNGHLIYEY